MQPNLKDSLFFPDDAFIKRCSTTIGILFLLSYTSSFISSGPLYSGSIELWTIIIFTGIYFIILLEIWIISKIITKISYKNLKRLESLIEDSSYSPTVVNVMPPSIIQHLSYKLNRRFTRKALADSGKSFTVEYQKKRDNIFRAKLYQIPRGLFFVFTLNVIVPLEEDFIVNQAS